MKGYKELALAACIVSGVEIASAFQPIKLGQRHVSSTELNVMPPMIISGAIKKYRDEQEKKRMPMASREEAKEEAPGLRVGASVWKWPPVWPYDKEFFMATEDIPQKQVSMNEMASMFSGIQQSPEQLAAQADATSEPEDDTKLDVLKYWAEEKADVRTEMDAEAVEKLKRWVICAPMDNS